MQLLLLHRKVDGTLLGIPVSPSIQVIGVMSDGTHIMFGVSVQVAAAKVRGPQGQEGVRPPHIEPFIEEAVVIETPEEIQVLMMLLTAAERGEFRCDENGDPRDVVCQRAAKIAEGIREAGNAATEFGNGPREVYTPAGQIGEGDEQTD